jgi:hypothetical protein
MYQHMPQVEARVAANVTLFLPDKRRVADVEKPFQVDVILL